MGTRYKSRKKNKNQFMDTVLNTANSGNRLLNSWAILNNASKLGFPANTT
jgi:hypothetical protein